MTTDAKGVAQEIARQLGGALLMIGAKHLGYGIHEGNPSLTFQICRNVKKVTHIRISLCPTDLCKLEFIQVRKYTPNILSTEEMVYSDQLRSVITKHTGLDTTFPV